MAKKYEDLELAVVRFGAEDVIATSGSDCSTMASCECVGEALS